MPLTETEALRLAGGLWADPVVRNRKRIEWQIWAREKYRTVAEHPIPVVKPGAQAGTSAPKPGDSGP
jgi:hypothetical protein